MVFNLIKHSMLIRELPQNRFFWLVSTLALPHRSRFFARRWSKDIALPDFLPGLSFGRRFVPRPLFHGLALDSILASRLSVDWLRLRKIGSLFKSKLDIICFGISF